MIVRGKNDPCGQVDVWCITRQAFIHTVKHGSPVHCVCLCPSANLLLVGPEKGTYRYTYSNQQGPTAPQRVTDKDTRHFCVSEDFRVLVMATADNFIRVWDLS